MPTPILEMVIAKRLTFLIFIVCSPISLKTTTPSSFSAFFSPPPPPWSFSVENEDTQRKFEAQKEKSRGSGSSVSAGSPEYDFYRDSCPKAENVTREVVRAFYKARSSVASALLWLAFHDCFIEDIKLDVNPSSVQRSMPMAPSSTCGQGVMQSSPGMGNTGLNVGVSGLPLKRWSLTGIDQIRPTLGAQVQRPLLHSASQFHLLSQQQHQLLTQVQQQGNHTGLTTNGDFDPRKLVGLPRGNLHAKDGQANVNDGSIGSPMQSTSSKGCDALILTDAIKAMDFEKDATPNNGSRSCDIIDIIMSEIEETYPGVVSCADVVVLAAREGVVQAGGPFYPMSTGRKDSTPSFPDMATYELPSPHSDLSETPAAFASRGLDEGETVGLLAYSVPGGHSIGVVDCKFFKDCLYNFCATNKPHPSVDTAFLNEMILRCNNQTAEAVPPLHAQQPQTSAPLPSFQSSPASLPGPSPSLLASPTCSAALLTSFQTSPASPSVPTTSFEGTESSTSPLPSFNRIPSPSDVPSSAGTPPYKGYKYRSLSSSGAPSSSFQGSLVSAQEETGVDMAYEGLGFGAEYYWSLLQGRGSLYSVTWNRAYASNAAWFLCNFAKLSNLQVLTGSMGQVWLNSQSGTLLSLTQTDTSIPNTIVMANCEVVKPRFTAVTHLGSVVGDEVWEEDERNEDGDTTGNGDNGEEGENDETDDGENACEEGDNVDDNNREDNADDDMRDDKEKENEEEEEGDGDRDDDGDDSSENEDTTDEETEEGDEQEEEEQYVEEGEEEMSDIDADEFAVADIICLLIDDDYLAVCISLDEEGDHMDTEDEAEMELFEEHEQFLLNIDDEDFIGLVIRNADIEEDMGCRFYDIPRKIASESPAALFWHLHVAWALVTDNQPNVDVELEDLCPGFSIHYMYRDENFQLYDSSVNADYIKDNFFSFIRQLDEIHLFPY